MKTRSTQRKNSAVARASHSTGRSNYSTWSGGIAALLEGNLLINTWLQPGAAPAERRRAVSTACRPHKKPLKWFLASTRHNTGLNTGLKPGVNEKQIIQTASEQSGAFLICQTVSGESPAPISATPSRKSDAEQIIQTLSGQSSTLQIRQTASAESGIYATVSRKSEIDLTPRTLESEIEKMRCLLESPAHRLRRK